MTSPTLILLAALAFQAPGPPFQSKEGGFSIAMPSAPTETTQQVPSALGPISVHVVRAAKGDVEYVVTYSDYPAQVAQDEPDKVLEGAANGAVGGFQGAKLVKKTNRKIGQTPGKEVEFSFPGPGGAAGLGRARLYLSGARMYSIMLVGPKDDVAKAGDAFFRSFGLSKAVASPSTKAAAKGGDAPAKAGRPAMAKAATKPAGRGGGNAPFVSEEPGFRVTLPAKPQEQKVTQPSPAGPIDVFVFLVPPKEDGMAYVVTATKLPEKAGRVDPKEELKGVVQGTLQSTKGTLVGEKDIRLGAAPGKEFDFTLPGAGGATVPGRSRAFVANGRIYQLLLTGPKDRVAGPAGTAFLDSFAILRPPMP